MNWKDISEEIRASSLSATEKEALGERLADVTAFVTVTDSEAAEEFENASASRINTPDLADRFLRRFG